MYTNNNLDTVVFIKPKPSVLPKTPAKINEEKQKGNVVTVDKKKQQDLDKKSHLKVLDANEEVQIKLPSIPHEFKIALQKARTLKGLTQNQLAQKLCVKTSIITDYESGKAIPSSDIIQKLNSVLATKLPKVSKMKKVSE